MPISLDRKAVAAMIANFDSAIPRLLADMESSKEMAFEVIAERHIDALLRSGPAHGGQQQYHVPNMIILSNTMGIAQKAAQDTVRFAAGHQPGHEEVQRLGEICGRLEAFINSKIDCEMKKRHTELMVATSTSSTAATTNALSTSSASDLKGANQKDAASATSTAAFEVLAMAEINNSSVNSFTGTGTVNTPSVGTSEFEMVDQEDAATTTSHGESEDWDLL
ncbi:hypothetical protein QBC39DRAFT_369536 [Podospora conica]|nr:hypothetical protein QBC39DRAFT_369536 [Schizothecium conicum]